MKLICAQPALPYYTWQVEVMINSFITQGVDPQDIQIILGYKDKIDQKWISLSQHYNPVQFFFYEDTRISPGYIPSIRPHILHKHWLSHPEMEQQTVLYHDSDIALFKPLQLNDLLTDDKCYVSDTVSYLGAQYVRSKGEHYLDLMTSIVGIDKQLVIDQENNSGGAQYLIKSVPSGFWAKVYKDCEELYKKVNYQITVDKPDHPIQIWCSDMWAVLWNLWLFGKQVNVSEKMSFSWATSPSTELDKHQFYHNAGVTGSDSKLFYKGGFINELPYTISEQNYSADFCSYHYASLIKDTATKSVLYNVTNQ